MLKQNRVFYHAVIDGDLFYTIYDYLRFNPEFAKDYKVFSTQDFDNLTFQHWKDLAEDAIFWLEHRQLSKAYSMKGEDCAPEASTWGTLYYQTLNYMAVKNIRKSTREMEYDELREHCVACINYLKELANEIRELDERDLENI